MSIKVNTNSGRYGNQLFPYFLGRIISDELKYKLYGNPIYDINYDHNQDGYSTHETPIQELSDDNLKTIKDFNEVIYNKTPRKIILSGFLQKKEFYIPYREKIKSWYNIKKYNIPENHVGMHIRLGDLLNFNENDHLLPIEYYEKALTLINFSNLNICTDTPSHPIIEHFKKKYNANIFLGNEKDTISFLSSHNNLILSQGTFSFWSGFLSNANTIINAIPKTGWNSHPELNLLIFEPNYRHIKI